MDARVIPEPQIFEVVNRAKKTVKPQRPPNFSFQSVDPPVEQVPSRAEKPDPRRRRKKPEKVEETEKLISTRLFSNLLTR